jgi:hypothetical protein
MFAHELTLFGCENLRDLLLHVEASAFNLLGEGRHLLPERVDLILVWSVGVHLSAETLPRLPQLPHLVTPGCAVVFTQRADLLALRVGQIQPGQSGPGALAARRGLRRRLGRGSLRDPARGGK